MLITKFLNHAFLMIWLRLGNGLDEFNLDESKLYYFIFKKLK